MKCSSTFVSDVNKRVNLFGKFLPLGMGCIAIQKQPSKEMANPTTANAGWGGGGECSWHSRADQFFFSATCPGQVASKNPLVLNNFLLVPKYFSNCKSKGQIANTTISYSKCNSNQYMRGSVT